MPIPHSTVYQRHSSVSPAMMHANLLVCLLNWLALGRPARYPSCFSVVGEFNKLQAAWWKNINEDICVWSEEGGFDVEDLGRYSAKFTETASIIEKVSALEAVAADLEAQLKPYCSHFTANNKSKKSGNVKDLHTRSISKLRVVSSVARPVIADRIKVTGPPTCNPLPLLVSPVKDPSVAEKDVYEKQRTAVNCNGSRDELIKLLYKLDQCDRVKIVPACDAPPAHRRVGLFSVYKDNNFDRLIVNAVPANIAEHGIAHWVKLLAFPGSLCELVLQPNQVLSQYASDVVDYYNRFVVSDRRCLRNALCCKFTAKDLRNFKNCPAVPGSQEVVVCLKILAMGDLQAVEIGQAVHLSLGYRAKALSEDTLIARERALPRGPYFAGVCVDDFCCFELETGQFINGKISPCDEIPKEAVAPSCVAAMKDQYALHNLESHPDKEIFRSFQCTSWGSYTDGVRGRHSSPLPKIKALVSLTLSIVQLGYATVNLLECITGSWVAVSLHNRRVLCLLDLLYAAISSHEQDDVLVLSLRLRQELCCLCIISPCVYTDMRAGAGAAVHAVDASSRSYAHVAAPVCKRLSSELLRHCCKKGRWSRLLAPSKRWLREHDLLPVNEQLPDGEYETSSVIWEDLVPSLQFELKKLVNVRKPEHINVTELRSWCLVEKDCSHDIKQHQHRPIILTDSQVGLAVTTKGRSSSPQLNAVMSENLPNVIAARLISKGAWLPSRTNPCDDPTRGKRVRRATHKAPAWVQAICEGPVPDFSLLDSMLAEHDAAFAADSSSLALSQFAAPAVFADADAVASADKTAAVPLSSQSASPLEDSVVDQTVSGQSSVTDNVNSKKQSKAAKRRLRKEARLERKVAKIDHVCNSSIASNYKWKPGPILSSIDKSRFTLRFKDKKDKYWTPTRPGVLCLFSGSKRFARAALRGGAAWVLCFELKDGPDQDVLSPSNQLLITGLLEEGSIGVLGAGPVCASFSAAVTPPVRTKLQPAGIDSMSKAMAIKVRLGNRMSSFCAKLVDLCCRLNICCWIENPHSSWLWRQRCWRRLFNRWPDTLGRFICHYCRFGTPWRKATMFATTGQLRGHTVRCNRNHEHVVLRGSVPLPGRPLWTVVAEPYPFGVAELLAVCCNNDAGWCSADVDPQRFADSACKRFASSYSCYDKFRSRKPRHCCASYHNSFDNATRDTNAPYAHYRLSFLFLVFGVVGLVVASAAVVDVGAVGSCRFVRCCNSMKVCSLLLWLLASTTSATLVQYDRPAIDRRQLNRHSAATRNRHDNSLAAFNSWLLEVGIGSPLDQLAEAPRNFDLILREFGIDLYDRKSPYYHFVYTLTGVQSKFRHLKGKLGYAWEFAWMWNSLEPVCHRRPVPEAVVRALVSAALWFGWRRFAVVTVLMFYGILRSVEPLLLLREHVILNEDMLDFENVFLYVKILRPKTAFRGGARQQHSKIIDKEIVCFCASILKPLEVGLKIWPFSAATYRKRFDTLCIKLGFEKNYYSPGGIRGGGAVRHFQTYNNIENLLWQMRLSSHLTLTHYLQEATSMLSLREVNPQVRAAVTKLASISGILMQIVSLQEKWGMQCELPALLRAIAEK